MEGGSFTNPGTPLDRMILTFGPAPLIVLRNNTWWWLHPEGR